LEGITMICEEFIPNEPLRDSFRRKHGEFIKKDYINKFFEECPNGEICTQCQYLGSTKCAEQMAKQITLIMKILKEMNAPSFYNEQYKVQEIGKLFPLDVDIYGKRI